MIQRGLGTARHAVSHACWPSLWSHRSEQSEDKKLASAIHCHHPSSYVLEPKFPVTSQSLGCLESGRIVVVRRKEGWGASNAKHNQHPPWALRSQRKEGEEKRKETQAHLSSQKENMGVLVKSFLQAALQASGMRDAGIQDNWELPHSNLECLWPPELRAGPVFVERENCKQLDAVTTTHPKPPQNSPMLWRCLDGSAPGQALFSCQVHCHCLNPRKMDTLLFYKYSEKSTICLALPGPGNTEEGSIYPWLVLPAWAGGSHSCSLWLYGRATKEFCPF